MLIGLIPLDDRPVNTTLPGMVAAVAGASTLTPPAETLPRYRSAGNPDAIADWLRDVAGTLDALVVSADMLGYGGLIASRTSHESVARVLKRLSVLTDIHGGHPDLPISAVTTVMRASNSYSNAEEPDYWSSYGVELHRLGAALHRDLLGEPHDLDGLRRAVPDPVRRDFLTRRLRNHAVDLYTLGLAADRTVDPLLVTADDTAERSAGSREQVWLDNWAAALELGSHVLSYPGADEVGCVLVARALAQPAEHRPTIGVAFTDPAGAHRVAPYENVPVRTTVERQVRAAGAVLVDDIDDAEAVLVVHPPHPDGGDLARLDWSPPANDEAVRAAATTISDLCSAGRAVGLADVRYANGGDSALVDYLRSKLALTDLAAYGGWNTAGNTIGSVAAALIAQVVAAPRGNLDATAARRLLLHRLVEDYGYQATVCRRLTSEPRFVRHLGTPFSTPVQAAEYLAACEAQLADAVASLVDEPWRLVDLGLPWNRTFEIDFSLQPPT